MEHATQCNTDLILLEIEAALHRCDEGNFKLCCECDEPIGETRLHIGPSSRKCIACAQHEK
ncbi:TraR/DksA C4-type zinc finger protein [Zhongshania sp. CAU 1632]|uniref:TraR/DksA C4-type zinc finger protein n=1 Tax=Zhongshania aquimaris TaxID=2857107 RepID=A0ABS6VT66_9GAMM|nr:TraR/DksA C4-type zinc finger protein [Zhongshania aquimaris]